MSEEVRLTSSHSASSSLLVGGCYRVQSQRSGESLDRTREGWPLLIGIRVAGLLMAGSIVAWLYNPAWFEPATLSIPESVHWLGVACLFALLPGCCGCSTPSGGT